MPLSPIVRYLSFDSLQEGIGASQVLAYVERLPSRGIGVDLHTFEKSPPPPPLEERLRLAGVAWTAHEFGRHGAVGGAVRVLRGAELLRSGELVHARGDLAAASAVTARHPRWIWDMRSFWRDQRIALGMLREGGLEERSLRAVERRSAQRSRAVISLTHAAIPVIAQRHGTAVAEKVIVLPTCVDTHRFSATAMPRGPMTVLLAGTINAYYDVPLMVRIVRELRERRPTNLVVASPAATGWEEVLADVVTQRRQLSHDEMPPAIRHCHVGLSICRDDAGISLTAAMPTKIAEFLSSGRPVVVNEGLGDAAEIVRTADCGVIVEGTDQGAVKSAADEIERLIADPGTPERCRAVAEAKFDLDVAADRLADLYRDCASAVRPSVTSA